MAPPKKSSIVGQPKKKSKKGLFQEYYDKYFNVKFLLSLIFDPATLPFVSILIVLAELVVNLVIVWEIPYTEIDWKAYMQECEGFLNGTTNYSLLRGDTGPLVYPAGFVYIFSIFYYITSRGTNIQLAQYIFVGIYLIQLWLMLRLYSKSRKIPPYVVAISVFTSYRMHSIYSLRLFNDPIAMLFAFAAINLFLDRKWTLGSICFSIGVGVKMNVLLFAPAVLLLYITNLGYVKTVVQLAICALVQLILGGPFLLTYPVEYLKGSFDLGRVFDHKWTVNYRFLNVDFFENKYFHIGLLVFHLVLLGIFAKPCYTFFQNYKRLRSFEKGLKDQNGTPAHPIELPKEEANEQKHEIHFDQCCQLALLPIFLCNFIGIICARSLHYQFYVWYFHTLPYLSWFTDYHSSFKILILLVIEFCWNQYPSTIVSSLLLHVCHAVLLVGISKKLFKHTEMANTVLTKKDD
ncbi:unnamed protein product [Diamesa tonsa]